MAFQLSASSRYLQPSLFGVYVYSSWWRIIQGSTNASRSIYTTSWAHHSVRQQLRSRAVARTVCTHTSTQLSSERHSVNVDIGGSLISISTGKYANLADGAVLVESGATSVMVTAVSEKNTTQLPYLPLTVDYRERSSAANKIRMNFFRREFGAIGGNDVLVSRFIDRSIRPLFPNGFGKNTQVICNMLQVDSKHDPEILSINGASAALMISGIPWDGPIGAVRVGLVDGELRINPNVKELTSSELNLVVSCSQDRIVMVEGSANEVSEEILCEAVMLGFKNVQPLISSMLEFKQQHSTAATSDHELVIPPPEVVDVVNNVCTEEVMAILADGSHSKTSRDNELFSLLSKSKEQVLSTWPDVNENIISKVFWEQVVRNCMRDTVLDKNTRCDGRGMKELRSIDSEVNVFESLHGSAVFKRGETQVLCSVTFDAPSTASRTDMLSILLGAEKTKRFMVHYEFPPFATNTIGHFVSIGRREVGHGALAEKALAPLVPKDFPYTIRVNSQVIDSNGSSSMATVCAGSLALFDAGVPMQCAAAGVACGLVVRTHSDSDEIQEYKILTDLNGIEDAVGNMDFKIAGTREGITSLQVDVKGIPGLPYHIFEEALIQSRDARYQVLDVMDLCMPMPRGDVKENGPAFANISIPTHKRMKLLGIGGYNLRSIQDLTGVRAEMISQDMLSVFAPTKQAMEEFREIVDGIVNEAEPEFEVGSSIAVTVLEQRDFGFIVELSPGVSSLLHISQLSRDHVKTINDFPLKVGDKVSVKYQGRNLQGRHLVSRKALMPHPRVSLYSSSSSNERSTGDGEISEEATAKEFEVGSSIPVTILEEREFGFIVELTTGVTAVLHLTQLSHDHVASMKDLMNTFPVKVGDKVIVKYVGLNSQGNHMISRKALLPPPTKDIPFQTGSVIEAKILDIKTNGCTVELAPGISAWLHKSHISHKMIPDFSQLPLKCGDTMKVKYLGKSSEGYPVVSRKARFPSPQTNYTRHTSSERDNGASSQFQVDNNLD